LTAVDSATGFVFSRLAKSRLSVVDHLILRKLAANSGRKLRFVRIDNEFLTKISRDWAKSNDISFQPSLPFANNTVRHVVCLALCKK
jgi:hypothetical protein